jgi:arylsulfatase A-like enzyme
VPLLIRFPGARGNRIEERFVSTVDLAPTIAEYAGVTPTLRQDGRSLLPLLNNTATQWRNSVLLERHINDDYYGIRVPGWNYVEFNSGFRELYDLSADPYEMQNVANQSQYAARQAELAAQLQAIKP